MGARDRLRRFFEKNVGRVVKTRELRKVAQISEYARRIRELRDEEGMQIRTHVDRHELKSDEYLLETLERRPAIARGISLQLRNQIFERNGYTCQLCGAGTGDPDPYDPDRKIRLHIDHIVPISQGGRDIRENLRAICSICNHGRANIQSPSESALNLLARIRRASRAVQKEVYEALQKSFS